MMGIDQKAEIETIREKTIKIRLSEADTVRISELCGAHGLSVGELLEMFIGDLIDGTYCNGSAERDKAAEWFGRCWFGMFPKESLLRFLLLECWSVENVIDILDDIQTFEEELQYSAEHPDEFTPDEIASLKEELEASKEELEEIKSDYLKSNPGADWQAELEAVKKWFDEMQRFKDE